MAAVRDGRGCRCVDETHDAALGCDDVLTEPRRNERRADRLEP